MKRFMNSFNETRGRGRESAPTGHRRVRADSRGLPPLRLEQRPAVWCLLFRQLVFVAFLAAGALFFTGCESTGGSSVSGGVYYGAGFYDPWYHGGYYYDDPDIIVTPPPRPDRPPARPTHPIAPTPSPRPMPMPSIPSVPRASFRR